MNNPPRFLFWPILLIGAGIVLLLANLNLIPQLNLAVLFRLWPVILIAVGLEILIGRRSAWISGVIGLAAVGLVIVFLLIGPSLGLAPSAQVQTGRFSEPVGEATSARVSLDLTDAPATIHGLADSNQLIDADLTYVGEIEFLVQGQQEKRVSLSQRWDSVLWFEALSLSPELRWEIGLSPEVPLDLAIDGGSGGIVMDLSALQLTGLTMDVGSGSVDLELPSSSAQYTARFDGGSGQVTIVIPDEADLVLEIEGGSGQFVLDVPDLAVRVEVRDSGSGEVRLPPGLSQVSAGDDDEGVWETADYAGAGRQVMIIVDDVGSGNIEVR
jgi:hypothetical protein